MFAVSTLKMGPVQVVVRSMVPHRHQPALFCKTYRNVGRVSYTDRTAILKCHRNRCRGTRRSPAKGKKEIENYPPVIIHFTRKNTTPCTLVVTVRNMNNEYIGHRFCLAEIRTNPPLFACLERPPTKGSI